MSTLSELWPKFRRSKKYREEFVAQDSRQAIPFQIAALLKQHTLTQEEVAKRAGLHQSSVSRAIDPSYGKMSLDTLVRIAAGFDVAFIGRFVPFSELPKWFDRLHNEPFTVPTFEQEDAALEAADAVAAEFRKLVAEVASAQSGTAAAPSDILKSQAAAMAQGVASLRTIADQEQRVNARDNLLSFEQRKGQFRATSGLDQLVPKTTSNSAVTSIAAEMRITNG